MTEIYLHIVARMADYMDTHPYHRMGAAEAEVMVGSLLKERPLQLTLAHLASARLSLDEPLGVQPARP